jgi:hypothetical protein
LKIQKVNKRVTTLTLRSLDTPAIKERCALEIKNPLGNLSELSDVEAMWDSFKTEVTNATRTTLGLQV